MSSYGHDRRQSAMSGGSFSSPYPDPRLSMSGGATSPTGMSDAAGSDGGSNLAQNLGQGSLAARVGKGFYRGYKTYDNASDANDLYQQHGQQFMGQDNVQQGADQGIQQGAHQPSVDPSQLMGGQEQQLVSPDQFAQSISQGQMPPGTEHMSQGWQSPMSDVSQSYAHPMQQGQQAYANQQSYVDNLSYNNQPQQGYHDPSGHVQQAYQNPYSQGQQHFAQTPQEEEVVKLEDADFSANDNGASGGGGGGGGGAGAAAGSASFFKSKLFIIGAIAAVVVVGAGVGAGVGISLTKKNNTASVDDNQTVVGLDEGLLTTTGTTMISGTLSTYTSTLSTSGVLTTPTSSPVRVSSGSSTGGSTTSPPSSLPRDPSTSPSSTPTTPTSPGSISSPGTPSTPSTPSTPTCDPACAVETGLGISAVACRDGSCVVTSCESGYALRNGACSSDCEPACELGTGQRGVYCSDLQCVVSGCLDGYTLNDNTCVADPTCDCQPSASRGEATVDCRDYGNAAVSNCYATGCLEGYELSGGACIAADCCVGATVRGASGTNCDDGECVPTACNTADGYFPTPSNAACLCSNASLPCGAGASFRRRHLVQWDLF